MNCRGDKQFYFNNKRAALQWLSTEIRKRENNLPEPDRDIYDYNGSVENKIARLYRNKQWAKLSPYYALYLTKKKFTK